MKIVVNFYANVTEASVNSLINFITQQLAAQNPQNPFDELIIQISSSGGSSDHGLLAYNFLRQLSIPKTTIGMGNVDSAAVMIFCAGDKRISTQSCRFVLHEARATINGEFNSTKLNEMARLVERITNDYASVVSAVTSEKQKPTHKKIVEGHVLSSDEAKNMKLVTEIIDKPYLKEMRELAIMLINNPVIPAIPVPPSVVPQPTKAEI